MGKRRIIFISVIIIIFIFCLKAIFYINLDPADDNFTNVELCPACYGNTLCPKFYHHDITFIGVSKLKYFKYVNVKNVYAGKLHNNRVILKKLAHDSELLEIDKKLCLQANLGESCNIGEAVKLLVGDSKNLNNQSNLVNILKRFKSTTDVSQCASERMLTYIFNKVNTEQRDYANSEYMQMYKIGELMYSLHVNPEAILLQAFPQTEGWPFPHYYGSCGRVIVEEYVGKSLAEYENASWEQRMDIAYQLLQMSQMLTENMLDFALYMTDLNIHNFAVRPDGTVFLIDVENIVIVDRARMKKGKTYLGDFHRSKGEFCKDCLNFSYEDLCNHDLSDHNYYAVCRGLLVPQSYYSAKGLLHNIPPEVESRTNLSALLKECADPTSDIGRFYVVPKILQVLKSLL